jgi:hypothetical protein
MLLANIIVFIKVLVLLFLLVRVGLLTRSSRFVVILVTTVLRRLSFTFGFDDVGITTVVIVVYRVSK